MEMVVLEDHEQVSRAAADIVQAAIREKPSSAVVAATGETPMDLYRELARRKAQGALDTSRMRVFQLDEYAGIGAEDHRSLYGWMKRSFLDPLAISPERTTRLRGDVADLEAACRAYDAAVDAAGGLDLAILGLGPNGHLGFNEPPSDPESPTRLVPLSPESVRSNAAYWGSEEAVPRYALTAGMNILLAARRIVLLVSGERKRAIFTRVRREPMTPTIPASYLQAVCSVTIVADRAAAGCQER